MDMATATWNGVVLAESDDVENVEGRLYFPASSLQREYLEPSETHSVCSWKGDASYYDVVVDGERNKDAVWYYPEPMTGAEMVTDRVSFWNGVEVSSD